MMRGSLHAGDLATRGEENRRKKEKGKRKKGKKRKKIHQQQSHHYCSFFNFADATRRFFLSAFSVPASPSVAAAASVSRSPEDFEATLLGPASWLPEDVFAARAGTGLDAGEEDEGCFEAGSGDLL
eukprot:comp20446_c0_seq2/m.41144 comp20446_c0_seq2/g.41144  ORF comp20446_c0_seq2/g.41144 comp20446_c0_seq2/m.41144 type:complete len:126 (-) comp20446_c0_seq2:2323-2700(-)